MLFSVISGFTSTLRASRFMRAPPAATGAPPSRRGPARCGGSGRRRRASASALPATERFEPHDRGSRSGPRLSRLVSAFVLAPVTSRLSTTDTSPDAILAASASRSAERRISVGIFLSYFLGVGPKGLPPPFHCVARIEPCRARPVPFCFHGFLPPPETSLLPFVSWVPARRAASSFTTAWWRSGTRTGPAKTSDSSSCCCALPFASSTGTLGMLLGLFGFLLL